MTGKMKTRKLDFDDEPDYEEERFVICCVCNQEVGSMGTYLCASCGRDVCVMCEHECFVCEKDLCDSCSNRCVQCGDLACDQCCEKLGENSFCATCVERSVDDGEQP